MKNITSFYYPKDEVEFKKQAKGSFVRTMIINLNNSFVTSYDREVNKIWSQTRKNNIETDHRVKALPNGDYHICSWVVSNKTTDFNQKGRGQLIRYLTEIQNAL